MSFLYPEDNQEFSWQERSTEIAKFYLAGDAPKPCVLKSRSTAEHSVSIKRTEVVPAFSGTNAEVQIFLTSDIKFHSHLL